MTVSLMLGIDAFPLRRLPAPCRLRREGKIARLELPVDYAAGNDGAFSSQPSQAGRRSYATKNGTPVHCFSGGMSWQIMVISVPWALSARLVDCHPAGEGGVGDAHSSVSTIPADT